MPILGNEYAFLFEKLLPQVLTATFCGFVVGYGREIRHRPAGIRTNILISVGCTIYASIGFHLAEIFPSVDPTRIIGQIATGIGFLGAGAIVKSEQKVTGVTTAAFIWANSGISILIGSNLYLTPIAITVLVVAISWLFERFERKVHEGHLEE